MKRNKLSRDFSTYGFHDPYCDYIGATSIHTITDYPLYNLNNLGFLTRSYSFLYETRLACFILEHFDNAYI